MKLNSISFFNNIYKHIILENNMDIPVKYNNLSIAIIPGTFKPPYKQTWQLLMEYSKLATDKIIVIISNVSQRKIAKRKLSKTNLTKLSHIISKIEEDTDIDITNIKFELLNNINSLTYEKLLLYCTNTLFDLLKNYPKILQELKNYLDKLKTILFKNIKLTETGYEISPEISLKIFQIYANAYNMSNKFEFIISKYQSPFQDMIEIIKTQCNNCDIYLSLDKKNDNNETEKYASLLVDLNKYLKENKKYNNLIDYPIIINSDITEEDIRDNVLNLERQWFPDKISDVDFDIIKGLLNE